MNKTKIEYLTHSWNPLSMRCTPVSDGCKNCWHLRMANRLSKNPMIDEAVRRIYSGELKTACLDNEELVAPFHCRKPARIGVQFMGDPFHESVNERFIEEIFWVMSECHVKEHSQYKYEFFILTKRPERMKNFLNWDAWKESSWPCVYFGVSVENQKTADERIPILLQIPTAHRWISVEPMLEQINVDNYLWKFNENYQPPRFLDEGEIYNVKPELKRNLIAWIVCGGETGPGARPMNPDWVRSLRDQCVNAGVPFFFKGWGEWLPITQMGEEMLRDDPHGLLERPTHIFQRSESEVKKKLLPLQTIRVGRKFAGRLLDGRTWDEFPK